MDWSNKNWIPSHVSDPFSPSILPVFGSDFFTKTKETEVKRLGDQVDVMNRMTDVMGLIDLGGKL